MLDFLSISTREKKGRIEIYPKFIIKRSTKDLMIRGRDFYAVWVEELGLWSTDEDDVIRLIDAELDRYAREHYGGNVNVAHMWDSESGVIDAWHKYCQKQMRDTPGVLDENLIFSNTETTKKDYASKRLPYPLEQGDIPAWDKLISTLYSEEERKKIEWAIGAIVSGDSKKLQKFLVLYGEAGAGKSTILNVIEQLFEGYYSVFDAKALGSLSNSFALEPFRTNPLVAIQHDGDLSGIQDNTRLNSVVSHEMMTMNEKFKPTYPMRFNAFLLLGTNKPVKITDGKSGLIRRLIDVTPSGKKLPLREYTQVTKQVKFELGAIAYHCLQVYLDNKHIYDDYIPIAMLGASNDFYNFVLDSYSVFKKEDSTTLKVAWEMYKTYCDEAKVPYPYPRRVFQEELKNYFWEFDERYATDDGSRIRSYYRGFRTDRFEDQSEKPKKKVKDTPRLIDFKEQKSIFDVECAGCLAQYATAKETPSKKWESVKTTLESLDTSRLHYVKVPENHIVIDFDIKDSNGVKSLERNIEEASKWPATYAELSKSGKGVHLHYIYTGDPTKLSNVYDDHIEVKVFSGGSSLRRKLTMCNDLPIASISSGLPLKGDKMVNFEAITNEKGLRTLIKRNLNKEIHPGTKPSIDFINKILDDAYSSGLKYDVSDMYNAVLAFAANSTNQANYCIKLVNNMHFKSDEPSPNVLADDAELVFYDVEVFPNLFLVNWKLRGPNQKVIRMINPTAKEIEELIHYNLVGFNCRRYDNHILYGRLIGYTNEQLYKLSQRIINGDKTAFFGEAYNLSYTDVYDFSSIKQSLKKFEIDLGIHHKELGLPWDQPVPEDRWEEVAEYCDNDVIATEAVFDDRKSDFLARQILADLAGMTVNDTTNSLTTKIIFGSNRKPQDRFNYRDMGDLSENRECYYVFDEPGLYSSPPDILDELQQRDVYNVFDFDKRPRFPGYKYEGGKSTYRGEEVGEGGYVYAEPGMYVNVALLDVMSMHPSSTVAEQLFGEEYTQRYKDIIDARVAIKHKDFDKARTMLNGALAKYLEDENVAADLAQALKIAINSVYGLTSASFDNPFRDIRNKDNIVAKRGALFMINLKHEVQKRGFTVAHIKTDSIKIPDATPEIIDFVMRYGAEYGYTFEHEATYEKMCLVNDAVYIAKYKDEDENPWTATGTQFAVPYVFKKLFSGESIEFDDVCETKSVKSAIYLDLNETLEDVTEWEQLKKLRESEKKMTKKEVALLETHNDISDEELDELISKGHDYHFIGKVGRFCPIKPGNGGGLLMRDQNGKYYAVTGSSGYRWMESEMVKNAGIEDKIDRSYYDALVDAAIDTMAQYGDVEWFRSDDPVPEPNRLPCGRASCIGCKDLHMDDFHVECKLGHDVPELAKVPF